jgi:LDH2 family malate/lactate/ureidoglycolate dehydrogenase
VAGDPEWRIEDRRKREGIPIDQSVWLRFKDLAAELKVTLPQTSNAGD